VRYERLYKRSLEVEVKLESWFKENGHHGLLKAYLLEKFGVWIFDKLSDKYTKSNKEKKYS